MALGGRMVEVVVLGGVALNKEGVIANGLLG